MRWSSTLNRGIEKAGDIFALAAGFVVLALFALIILDVTLRAAIGHSFTWLFDTTEMSLLAIFFLPAARIARKGGHVSVDMLTKKLHGRLRFLIDLLAYVLTLAFGVLIVVAGWDDVFSLKARHTLTMTSALPVWPAVVFIFLGGLLYTLQIILLIAGRIKQGNTPKPSLEESA